MKSSCKMKVMFCDYCVCVCVCACFRERERKLLAGFCVIRATDSGPAVVSSTAGSEASLSY